MERSYGSRPHVHFEVEKVIGVSSDGSYQVQWAPAWVSKFHLVGCEHLIQEFLRQQSEKNDAPEMLHKTSHQSHQIISHESDTVTYESDAVFSDHNEHIGTDKELNAEPVPADSGQYTGVNDDPGGLGNQFDYTVNHNEEVSFTTENKHGVFQDICDVVVKIEDADEVLKEAVGCCTLVKTSSSNLDQVRDVLSKPVEIAVSTMVQGDSISSCTNINSKYDCSVCGRCFSNEKNLTAHQLTHSTEERQFACELCQKNFRQKGHLKAHLRTHTDERPFTCEYCGKAFRSKSHLTDHLRIHTGIKPFACEVCGKTFAQSGYRNQHMRRCASSGRFKSSFAASKGSSNLSEEE